MWLELLGQAPPDYEFDPSEEEIQRFLVLLFLGFLIGGFGHLIRSKWLIATGILFVFLAVLIVPLVMYLSGR
jgi:hypothetical protein